MTTIQALAIMARYQHHPFSWRSLEIGEKVLREARLQIEKEAEVAFDETAAEITLREKEE